MNKIWAVAKNTIYQALQMKVALVIIILLIILIPMMSVITTGDGTLKGRLQTFTSYGLSLTALMLCTLTVFVSAYSLTSDLKNKTLFLVLSKPIRRYHIILGKFIGIAILNVILLGIFTSIIYLITIKLPDISEAPSDERQVAQNEFFTARISLEDPVEKDIIRERALAEYDKREKAGRLPEELQRGEILQVLFQEEYAKENSVEVGTRRVWEFNNVNPAFKTDDPNSVLFIKYKLQVAKTPPDEKVKSIWIIGDLRQEELGPNQWDTPVYRLHRSDTVKKLQEVPIPADAVTPDGYVAVALYNDPYLNRSTIIPDEFELLYRAGSFTTNFFRACLIILMRLFFLTALGLFASAWLSFPTTILLSFTVYFIGTINGFIKESLEFFGENPSQIFTAAVNAVIWFLPRFDGDYSPTQYIIEAGIINWVFIAKIFAALILVKALLLIIFGIFIFNRREIARVIV